MFSPKRLLMVAVFPLVMFEGLWASEINQNSEGGPIICYSCGSGIKYDFGSVSQVWPGDTIAIPVLVQNDTALQYIEMKASCSSCLEFIGIDPTDSPWPGATFSDTTNGDKQHFQMFADWNGTDTLPQAGSYRRVFDALFWIKSATNFHTSFIVLFSNPGCQARKYGSASDCDVDQLSSGGGSIPADTVQVILDMVTAYSYQASDDSVNDPYKDDYPLAVPIELYTNFPLGSYYFWFEEPNSGADLDLLYFDGADPGDTITSGGIYHGLHGRPENRPDDHETTYLGDFKFKVRSFRSSYLDSTFSDTIYLNLIDHYMSLTQVSCWNGTAEIRYDSIAVSNGGINLPQYKVTLDLKDATVGIDDKATMPMSILPTFHTQDYLLRVEFDTSKINHSIILNNGGSNLPTPVATSEGNVAGTQRIRYRIESYPMYDTGKFALPNVEDTLFSIKFTRKSTLAYGESTQVIWTTIDGSSSLVYDWFSPNGPTNKIKRYKEQNAPYFETLSGWIKNPVYYNLKIGDVWCSGTNYKIPIEIQHIEFTGSDHAKIGFISSYTIDSITAGDFSLSGIQIYSNYVLLDLGQSISTTGVLANIWMTIPKGIATNFGFTAADTWMLTNSEQDTVHSADGDAQGVGGCKNPKLEGDETLPVVTSLGQNYPNPFNAQCVIEYALPTPSHVRLEVLDIVGRKVAILANEEQAAGYHQVTWNAKDQPSGMYFYRLQAGDFIETKKMLLMK
jgi:hypothetical protein